MIEVGEREWIGYVGHWVIIGSWRRVLKQAREVGWKVAFLAVQIEDGCCECERIEVVFAIHSYVPYFSTKSGTSAEVCRGLGRVGAGAVKDTATRVNSTA